MRGRMVRLAAACAVALVLVPSAAGRSRVPARHSFVWPASGRISRYFGYDSMGFHPGIDIGSLRSLDVRAAVAGVVAAVGYTTGFEGYGQIVLVDDGSGLQTLYAHFAAVKAHVGERVVPGRLLGIAGCTGYCTGTHLHFEVRVDGKAVNPLPLLPVGVPIAPSSPAQARRIDERRVVRSMFAHLPRIELRHWLGPRTRQHRVVRLLSVLRRPLP